MLPVESLTEAVSFLPLCDLDSILLASRQLTSIASKCVKGIRIWDFHWINVGLCGETMIMTADGDEERFLISGKGNIANVLDIALYNSRIKALAISLRPVDDIPVPNKSALEIEELLLGFFHGVPSAGLLLDVITRFRKVKVIRLYDCENITDFSPVIDWCRHKGISSVINMSNGVDLMAEQ